MVSVNDSEFPAIVPFILKEMSNQCEDSDNVYNRLVEYEKNNRDNLKEALLHFSIQLLKKIPYGLGVLDILNNTENSLKELDEIVITINKLQSLLSDISDLKNTHAKDASRLNKLLWLNVHFANAEGKTNKLNEWNDFISYIRKYSTFFYEMKSFLEVIEQHNPVGRPTETKELNSYVYQMARMYISVTGKKFRVRNNDGLSPYTEGMKFVKESLIMLYLYNLLNRLDLIKAMSSKELNDAAASLDKEKIFSQDFNETSFQSVCEEVRKRINKEDKKNT